MLSVQEVYKGEPYYDDVSYDVYNSEWYYLNVDDDVSYERHEDKDEALMLKRIRERVSVSE